MKGDAAYQNASHGDTLGIQGGTLGQTLFLQKLTEIGTFLAGRITMRTIMRALVYTR